jgi:hypothetical protein
MNSIIDAYLLVESEFGFETTYMPINLDLINLIVDVSHEFDCDATCVYYKGFDNQYVYKYNTRELSKIWKDYIRYKDRLKLQIKYN